MTVSTTGKARRKKQRKGAASARVVRVCRRDGLGNPRWMTADLNDHSETGLGITLIRPLEVGSTVELRGSLPGRHRGDEGCQVRVAWCLEKLDGTYRVGLEFEDSGPTPVFGESNSGEASGPRQEDDYYEILQLSPKADPETLHRVYRILAQRYHPDNKDTGDEEMFKRVLEAYRVLDDPEQRAAYDVRRRGSLRQRWKIFHRPGVADGVEAEKRKRQGILALLYTKRMREPAHPGVSIRELEELLDCPRDHLEFSLWYLKEHGFLRRSDRGFYEITVAGADRAESEGLFLDGEKRLLPAGDSAPA